MFLVMVVVMVTAMVVVVLMTLLTMIARMMVMEGERVRLYYSASSRGSSNSRCSRADGGNGRCTSNSGSSAKLSV